MRGISVLTLLLLLGCSAAQVKERSDGSMAIECNTEKVCFERAHRVCGEQGYVVIGGRRTQKTYGGPDNHVVVGKNEIYVRCGASRPGDEPKAGTWSLERDEGAERPASPAATAAPVPSPTPHATASMVCRPGETQRCVGPGACDGGQSCREDGSGFGPCDCGTNQPAPLSPAPRDGGL